ncbi:MAG: hypothetical protein IKM88_09070 [Lachnospiraceae bacterium]|nr:hypothetical protein [Lachnospiraceae bacterium]MBR3734999.1 hypothetical protein [Lachnospiraceae bacterium]MBR6850371.1 hypothetical protein [Lachnospiraceae bacterium]
MKMVSNLKDFLFICSPAVLLALYALLEHLLEQKYGLDMTGYMTWYCIMFVVFIQVNIFNVWWASESGDDVFEFIDLTIATVLGFCISAILFTGTYLWNIPLIVKILYAICSSMYVCFEWFIPVGYWNRYYIGWPGEYYYPGRLILVAILWPAFLIIRVFREIRVFIELKYCRGE